MKKFDLEQMIHSSGHFGSSWRSGSRNQLSHDTPLPSHVLPCMAMLFPSSAVAGSFNMLADLATHSNLEAEVSQIRLVYSYGLARMILEGRGGDLDS